MCCFLFHHKQTTAIKIPKMVMAPTTAPAMMPADGGELSGSSRLSDGFGGVGVTYTTPPGNKVGPGMGGKTELVPVLRGLAVIMTTGIGRKEREAVSPSDVV